MFDPTAFENLKVVMEGCFYDYDLNGEIVITDRNDLVNLAKLSRTFEITFRKKRESRAAATFILQADLANLAAELLPASSLNSQSGASVSLKIVLLHPEDDLLYKKSLGLLKSIWGNEHIIRQHITKNISDEQSYVEIELTLSFNRIIQEDQVDDLENMAEYMVRTVTEMDNLIKR